MRDGADGARAERIGGRALLASAADHRRRVRSAGRQTEHDDVRLHRGEVELDSAAAHYPRGDAARVHMVFHKLIAALVERVKPRGGEDADLAHRAAEHPAMAHSACDELT